MNRVTPLTDADWEIVHTALMDLVEELAEVDNPSDVGYEFTFTGLDRVRAKVRQRVACARLRSGVGNG